MNMSREEGIPTFKISFEISESNLKFLNVTSTYVSFLIKIQYIITIAEPKELTIVARAAPAEPKFKTYMNKGSNTKFRITETIIAYIALFMSPSPRRIPLPPLANMNAIKPKNNGVP